MTSPVRVLIADDQLLFREGLHTLLSVQPDLHVVGEARNGEEALRLAAVLKPDVILMDLRMPLLNGIAATRRLKTSQPECKVIVLTTFDDDEDLFGSEMNIASKLGEDVAGRGEILLSTAARERLDDEARASLERITIELSGLSLEAFKLRP